MARVWKFVICNVSEENEKAVLEALLMLVRKGKVKMEDVHAREEEI